MREVLPDLTDEYYWNYNRGGALSTHYDILLKSHLGALLWYKDWRDDPSVLDCALKGADFCLQNVAEENADEWVWSGKYGQEDSLMLALGKAGMMVDVLAPLVDMGHQQYSAPLKKTVAFILHRKEEPEVWEFWDSAWAQFSVVAPLFRAAYRGIGLL